jgi:nucleotide-binding universal stress UspA family protein
MFNPGRILLASHGTPGARAAEEMALKLTAPGATLFHLIVVPDLWRGMMGDDWLSNASTRAEYGKYIEDQLGQEIERHREVLEREVRASQVAYELKVMLGKPDECLLEHAATIAPDLVVVGSPRPRGTPGLRSRMRIERLTALAAPLLVVPYPR